MSSAVQIGFWRNWDPNIASHGLTLTLPIAGAVIFVSFTTFLIAIAGQHLWAISAFVLHQLRSTPVERDGLYHEQQSLLANTLSSATTAWKLLSMLFKWRKSSNQPVWPTACLVFAAVFQILAVASTSIAISRWLHVDNVVLAKGDRCGSFSPDLTFQTSVSRLEQNNIFYLWGRWVASESLNYAQRCYFRTRPEAGACKAFQMPSFPITNRTVKCPFDERMCALSTAFEVDSGYLDSDKHLGINLPPDSRVRLRKIITCAPTLAEENFSTDWVPERPPTIEEIPGFWGDTYKYYHLGGTPEEDYSYVLSKYAEQISQADYTIE